MTAAPVRPTNRYPGLDGLRAVAATAVVATHAAFWTGNYTEDGVGRLLARLDIGVALFFVLSGFLLSLPMLRAAAEGRPQPRAAAYLWRRALRVLPVYWLTVAVSLLLLPVQPAVQLADWLRHFALLQVYGFGWFREGLTHTWSLCTEVAFYAALPFVIARLVRLVGPGPWRPWRVLGGLGVVVLAGLVWLAWTESDEQVVAPLNLWLPSFATWFGAGVAMAVLTVSAPDWRPTRRAHDLGSSPWTCWAVAAALFWIACTPVAGPVGLTAQSATEAVIRNLLYAGAAALAVWPLVFGDQSAGRARAVLSSAPLTRLGEVSYGTFLFHLPVLVGAYAVLDQPTFTGDPWRMGLISWIGGTLLAVVSYRLLERPMMRRWRNLVPDRAPAGAGSSAVTTAATATAPNT